MFNSINKKIETVTYLLQCYLSQCYFLWVV